MLTAADLFKLNVAARDPKEWVAVNFSLRGVHLFASGPSSGPVIAVLPWRALEGDAIGKTLGAMQALRAGVIDGHLLDREQLDTADISSAEHPSQWGQVRLDDILNVVSIAPADVTAAIGPAGILTMVSTNGRSAAKTLSWIELGDRAADTLHHLFVAQYALLERGPG